LERLSSETDTVDPERRQSGQLFLISIAGIPLASHFRAFFNFKMRVNRFPKIRHLRDAQARRCPSA